MDMRLEIMALPRSDPLQLRQIYTSLVVGKFRVSAGLCIHHHILH